MRYLVVIYLTIWRLTWTRITTESNDDGLQHIYTNFKLVFLFSRDFTNIRQPFPVYLTLVYGQWLAISTNADSSFIADFSEPTKCLFTVEFFISLQKLTYLKRFFGQIFFQTTADLYNLLHIVNELVDIVHKKIIFIKVIRNVNYKGEKNWRDSLLISPKLCMFISIHRCLKPNSLWNILSKKKSKSKTSY